MSNPTSHAGAVSLDDLLRDNKDQFDRIFTAQMAGGDLAAAGADTASAAPAGIAARLNARFGDTWSSEVVEHKSERGAVTVLCRLSVGEVSKMQFGSARIQGDAGRALQRATEAALLSCAAQFADSPAAQTQAPASERQRPMAAAAASAAQPAQTPSKAPSRSPSIAAALPGRIDVALRNARDEMEIVLSTTAMGQALRDGHGQAALIADARGRMLVGRFNFAIAALLERESLTLEPGDVLLLSDPYASQGAVTGLGDWLVLMPIVDAGERVGFTAMRVGVPDVGGPVDGSRSAAAGSLYGEGLCIPPLKLIQGGELNDTALRLILGNSRSPAVNRNDLMAAVDACQAGAARVVELCRRFGRERYAEACDALLSASGRTMRRLIVAFLSEEPQSFEDVIDDDGRGNGPFRLRLTVWREGEQAFFDWTGTAAQAPGPVNFFLNQDLFKLTVAMYLSGRSGAALALNDGIGPLMHVTMPTASLLQPAFPAALGQGAHADARQLEVLGGAMAHASPETATAAGYGSLPQFHYAGRDGDGRAFQLRETLLGGLAGRPAGDGIDGHSLWPHRDATPAEYLERHFPIVVERRHAIADSGGAGRHRGGNGVETIYLLKADGTVSLQDDRHISRPWGLSGGKPGSLSERWIERRDGSREALPAKVDGVAVRAGERLILRTAGGGGWGDPLTRPPGLVHDDVTRGLLSEAGAEDGYGVVLQGSRRDLDPRATEDLRDSMRRNRRSLPLFDFGGRRDAARDGS